MTSCVGRSPHAATRAAPPHAQGGRVSHSSLVASAQGARLDHVGRQSPASSPPPSNASGPQ
eukprot:6331738-Prymnesium_polylepis.1